MALSLSVMGFNVPVDLSLNAIEAVCNDSVVVLVVAHQSMDKCNNNREAATNESNENAFSHVITEPVGMGSRLLPWRLLHAIRARLRRHAAT